jgi:hypothetical protein
MKVASSALLLACLLSAVAHSQTADVWRTAGAENLGKGKLDGVSVLATGALQLAPATDKLKGLEAEFVWDVQLGPGNVAFVGTGGPAAVFRVEGDKVRRVFKCDEKHVFSVLPMADGSVLAATAPRGIIYRIPAEGKPVIFADLEEAHIWAMAPAPKGGVYCATGPNGRIIQLDSDGQATELFAAPQKNVMCLAVAADGTIYAGVQPDGRVYRVTPKGKATVVFDADEQEIRDMVLAPDGVLYVATAGGKAGGGAPASVPAESAEATPRGDAGNGAPNSIYRVEPGKGATRIAVTQGRDVMALALVGQRVLAGTGSRARILAIEPDGLVRMLADIDATHASAMLALPDGDALVGTSSPGGLLRIRKGVRKTGTYLSPPFDAGLLARWGRLWWHQSVAAGQAVRVRLRTGATDEPDEHWTDWSGWLSDAAGDAVKTAPGRFAQIEVELSAKPGKGSPSVLEVAASFRQVNRKPVIAEFAADAVSLLRRNGAQEAANNARPPAPGVKLLTWEAADPNGDALKFAIHYRAVDEKDWKLVKDDIRDAAEFKWDTSRVPDGHYLLRLTADDAIARPGPEALSDARVGMPLLIDSRRPVVESAAKRRPDGRWLIVGTARDAHSHITAIMISHNGGPWRSASAEDGMLDAREEKFRFVTEKLPVGEHIFVITTTDSGHNTGSAKSLINVK